jgi:hypothetical protein
MTVEHVTPKPLKCRYKNNKPITYETMVSILNNMISIAKSQDKKDATQKSMYTKHGDQDFYETEDEQNSQAEQRKLFSLDPTDTPNMEKVSPALGDLPGSSARLCSKSPTTKDVHVLLAVGPTSRAPKVS